MKGTFKEEDKQKFIEFLNYVAKHAEFKFRTQEVIDFYKLLAHMQTEVLPKIIENIFEIQRVVEVKDPAEVVKKVNAKKSEAVK